MRRIFLPAFLVAAAALGAPPAAADEARIERSREFVERVNAAIDRGVAWLRQAGLKDGGYAPWGEYRCSTTALAYHTMRVCGVARDDAGAVATFDALRREYADAKTARGLRTYAVALVCMAVAEHGVPSAATDKAGRRRVELSKDDAAWMQEMVDRLQDWQDVNGRWGYADTYGSSSHAFDNSNTQYALLGLKAAARAGATIRPSTWRKALSHFVSTQDDDGKAVPRPEPTEKGATSAKAVDHARGWNYGSGAGSYGSMTAGGVGSVVICRSELLGTSDYGPETDAKAEQSARDGIAWLGLRFTPKHNPTQRGPDAGPSAWLYYWLYGVERAGVLAGVERMGAHDWYGEGAEYLLDEQTSAGGWVERGGLMALAGVQGPQRQADAVVTTCFALLFLKKGTLAVAQGALTKSTEDDINFDAAKSVSAADFEDFLDLVLSRRRRAATPDAVERLLAKTTSVGPRLVQPLIVRLSSGDAAEREGAFAVLVRATGEFNGYDPSAAPDAREDAVLRWQAWWLANEKRLRYDEAAGRLVSQ